MVTLISAQPYCGYRKYDGVHRHEFSGYIPGGYNTVTGYFAGEAFTYTRHLTDRWSVSAGEQAQFLKKVYSLDVMGTYRLPVGKANLYFDGRYETDNDSYAYTYDEITLPFFPVVGNHDITHNGWALWSNIFHSSFYEMDIIVIQPDGQSVADHLVFLDSASGTLGKTQIDLINQGALDGRYDEYRYTFVFTHTNIFRPPIPIRATT